MNRNAMLNPLKSTPFPAFVLALSISLGLAACSAGSGSSNQTPVSQAPLYGATIGGPFTLTDKNDKTVHWSDFAGKYRIVYFGYTYCPDVCPTDVQRIMQGYRGFADEHPMLAEKVQPMFISIDPERDTPKVVGEFASAFSDKLLGLTGTPDQVKQAADEFRVFYSKGPVSDGGGYLMQHSSIAYLFGPDGKPIATLPTDKGADAVTAELAKWIR